MNSIPQDGYATFSPCSNEEFMLISDWNSCATLTNQTSPLPRREFPLHLLERVRVRQGEGGVPQDMTANQTQTRRKRGGQKGNGNARKHGFYSAALSPAQTSQLWNIVNLEGVDPEVALIRVKLQSSLQHDPGNRRVIKEASRLIVKWYSESYGLDATTGSYLKSVVQDLLETASIRQSTTPDLSGRANVLSLDGRGLR
jgi:hypothetical protein